MRLMMWWCHHWLVVILWICSCICRWWYKIVMIWKIWLLLRINVLLLLRWWWWLLELLLLLWWWLYWQLWLLVNKLLWCWTCRWWCWYRGHWLHDTSSWWSIRWHGNPRWIRLVLLKRITTARLWGCWIVFTSTRTWLWKLERWRCNCNTRTSWIIS